MARTKSQTIVGLEKRGVAVVDPQEDFEPVTQDPKLHLKEVAALEKFMAERVTVLIMATTDANAPPYCDLSVNGMKAVVRRNVPTTIRRMHLEVLARMKETRWVQPPVEGTKAVGMESLVGHTALAYPFQVVEDTNPKGNAWLQAILAEAA
jgi:hypothetical protein